MRVEEDTPMVCVVTDPGLEERLKAERRATGADRFDEVWDGVYLMSPLANVEHQFMVMQLALALHASIPATTPGQVYPGINVSDRELGWEKNYRCPDLAVILMSSHVRNCGAHFCGGPDFLVEIMSPGDRAYEKIPFYSQVGVRELLIIDREPWTLKLYRLENNVLEPAGESTPPHSQSLTSAVLPLTFRLVAGPERPVIELSHSDGVQKWMI